MPKRKLLPRHESLVGEKDCWHPYSLQMLSPAKFGSVVSRILNGRYTLIHAKGPESAQPGY